MPVLAVVNVHHSYGTHAILDGATVSIEEGEKVGLVGRNGSGKTTLMKVMQGRLSPDSGQVQLQRGSRVGYLSQDPDLDFNDTLRDAAEGAFAELHRLHVESHKLYDDMAHAEGVVLEKLLKQQVRLEGQIEAAGGYTIDHKIDAMLHGLGFTDEQFNLKVANLSGGQKGRLGLARLLLEQPDLLLLDEPTNHLDIAGRQWLETFLAEDYPGAVVVVSHDRWLLDRVVNRIIEVDRGVVRESPGNYHKYVELRQERMLTQARVYDKQMDRIRQEQTFIDKYRAGQRARQAKGREARLERYKRDEVMERPIELEVMNLKLPKAPRSGDQVVVAENISKAYGEKVLFKDMSITIMRGERIGIIGPNGAGKTTLVRCLLGELAPDSGEIRTGSRLSVGYYKQLHDHLDMSLRIWQYLQSVITANDGSAVPRKGSEQQARDLAGAFLFSGDEQEKVLGQLSGGERSRAVLAGLMAAAHNILVLDEPTNHLDIPSAERLEQALTMAEDGYEGTLLLITHDRQLLQDTCSKLIILDGVGGSRVIDGSYSDWERRQRDEAAKASGRPEPKRVAKPQAAVAVVHTPAASTAKKVKPTGAAALSFEKLEAQIQKLQTSMEAIDKQLGDPSVYGDGGQMRQLQTDRAHLERELEPLEQEWARRADEA